MRYSHPRITDRGQEDWCYQFSLRVADLTGGSLEEALDFAVVVFPQGRTLPPDAVASVIVRWLEDEAADAIGFAALAPYRHPAAASHRPLSRGEE